MNKKFLSIILLTVLLVIASTAAVVAAQEKPFTIIYSRLPEAEQGPDEIFTSPPPAPTQQPSHANCGVGNGVDLDTPGCPNGRNDGPGTGPGNPGSKGGNGNGR